MKQLKELFDQQKNITSTLHKEENQEEVSLVRFFIGGCVFAVHIENVIEVSELLPIVRYPEFSEGHIGIINLRGNILPVLTFREQKAQHSHLKLCENRLIVLEFKLNQRFCALVSSPKKINLLKSEIEKSNGIVSIDNMPARILSEKDFPIANSSS